VVTPGEEVRTMNETDADTTPPSLAGTTTVIVRGFDNICWKCDRLMTCVIAIHAEGARRSDDWVWFEDKHALSLGRDLLLRAGKAEQAATVKERFSKTAGGSYLSNGCPNCDAIQGDWPLAEAVSEFGQGAPLEELPVLTAEKVPTPVWQDILANQEMRRHGYPMTWADLDQA
jgi:hypothetical protein